MPSDSLFDRLKIPVGSLLADSALVLTLVFSTGQMMERFEAMDTRLQRIESLQSETRIGALELRANQSDRYQAELKNDIVKRLDRIEALLDNQRSQ